MQCISLPFLYVNFDFGDVLSDLFLSSSVLTKPNHVITAGKKTEIGVSGLFQEVQILGVGYVVLF